MRQNLSLALLIGATLVVALGAENQTKRSVNRNKRQAPNINVHQIPKTSFTCDDKKVGEYYADPETSCQVYHVCIPGMHNKMSLMSFVCPNGTIFNQATRVCSPYDRVDCRLALQFYETVHGNLNSRRTDFEADSVYDNYVPPAPSPPRQSVPAPPPRQPAATSRVQPQAVSRNTIPQPEAEEPAQPVRGSSRFRSGASQFRGPQSRLAQTPPPVRQPPPLPTVRQQAPAIRQQATPAPPAVRQPASVARPPVPGFRGSAVAGRPSAPVTQPPAVAPPRPTVRTVVSTSTANYNYEYEYEYDYEDEVPDQANTRSKRDTSFSMYTDDYESQELDIEREPQKTGFSCRDKVPGGVYADIETDCEMFHICVPLGKHKMLDYKVYCANSTAFDQETGSCKEKTKFKCAQAQLFYQVDKLNQPPSGKKPVYKKSSYSKSKKLVPSYKTK